jgi:hypothetical protein
MKSKTLGKRHIGLLFPPAGAESRPALAHLAPIRPGLALTRVGERDAAWTPSGSPLSGTRLGGHGRSAVVSCQAVVTQVWLDVPAGSRVESEIDDVRRDVRFTVSREHDEFELTFEPTALRRFAELGEVLLAQLGSGG